MLDTANTERLADAGLDRLALARHAAWDAPKRRRVRQPRRASTCPPSRRLGGPGPLPALPVANRQIALGAGAGRASGGVPAALATLPPEVLLMVFLWLPPRFVERMRKTSRFFSAFVASLEYFRQSPLLLDVTLCSALPKPDAAHSTLRWDALDLNVRTEAVPKPLPAFRTVPGSAHLAGRTAQIWISLADAKRALTQHSGNDARSALAAFLKAKCATAQTGHFRFHRVSAAIDDDAHGVTPDVCEAAWELAKALQPVELDFSRFDDLMDEHLASKSPEERGSIPSVRQVFVWRHWKGIIDRAILPNLLSVYDRAELISDTPFDIRTIRSIPRGLQSMTSDCVGPYTLWETLPDLRQVQTVCSPTNDHRWLAATVEPKPLIDLLGVEVFPENAADLAGVCRDLPRLFPNLQSLGIIYNDLAGDQTNLPAILDALRGLVTHFPLLRRVHVQFLGMYWHVEGDDPAAAAVEAEVRAARTEEQMAGFVADLEAARISAKCEHRRKFRGGFELEGYMVF